MDSPRPEYQIGKYAQKSMEEQNCQLCRQGGRIERTLCGFFYEISGRYQCVFERDFHPQWKVTEYKKSTELTTILIEIKRERLAKQQYDNS